MNLFSLPQEIYFIPIHREVKKICQGGKEKCMSLVFKDDIP